jgi:Type VI secretion system/phage-baseplate injector OB domain
MTTQPIRKRASNPSPRHTPGKIMTQMFGKYRGKVRDNDDPLRLGRLQVAVPSVLGQAELWAMPCVPYAGNQLGWFCPPPVGPNVWVEFEGGNIDMPIWSGCFWADGELPVEATSSSSLVFKSNTISLTINDTAAGVIPNEARS